ncbi:MAG: hypothetical protein LC808_04745 [Actinobacteria bacterium]|nr:hypothetical protein [Actinomycetota bacterium]
MTPLAPALQAFFTERLITQRNSSPQTIAAYRECAARRPVVSPAQPGGTRREVLGSDGLPESER